MPIGGDPLPAEQIDLIARWVDQLSPEPEASGAEATETAGAAASAHQFETAVKPLLEQHCFTCHSIQNHQSGLVLETLASLLKGGSLGGPGVIPGDSASSPLIQRLRGDKAPQMPLNGEPFSEEQVEAIARWIDELEVAPVQETADAGKPAWPWIPLEKPAVPEVKRKSWVKNPIDAFVLAKLEEKGMEPAPAVGKRQLLRRLYFGLIGLPPTPDEMNAFLQDDSPDAYHNAVEKLLADSRYGERWAGTGWTWCVTAIRWEAGSTIPCPTCGATGTTSSGPSTRTSLTTASSRSRLPGIPSGFTGRRGKSPPPL